MLIRAERANDIQAIRALVAAAFRAGSSEQQDAPEPQEPLMIDGLRQHGALTLSLVAEEAGVLLGHIAFSPLQINGRLQHWYGLAPLAVLPTRQKSGIGRALVEAGLERLTQLGAHGCVVLGDPAYYSRLGFAMHPGLTLDNVPPEYFMARALGGAPMANGTATYHKAFGLEG
ncbi:GNAT family N-acetyltransferase [Paraburkholderia hayleyella]|uniref:GNAT family N-acetyltransferase n=1 Tax=Paraburkholderia hayleyella TaxID=2152889 RepID=UPI001290B810|nr:N-acetyltransferase [Paraburkholderia hayleyella]